MVEQNQRADGSVVVPEVLRKYLAVWKYSKRRTSEKERGYYGEEKERISEGI